MTESRVDGILAGLGGKGKKKKTGSRRKESAGTPSGVPKQKPIGKTKPHLPTRRPRRGNTHRQKSLTHIAVLPLFQKRGWHASTPLRGSGSGEKKR